MMDVRRKRRLLALQGLSLALAFLVAWRFAGIMLFGSSDRSPGPARAAVVERGPILDRNGRILAIQTRLYSVSAWRPNVTEPEETAEALAEILSLDRERILERLLEGPSNYLFIKRKVSPTESGRIEELKAAGRLEGISLEPESGRSYPEKELAAHLIGYAGTDNVGLSGVELMLNDELSPERKHDERTDDGNAYGNQVFLTIDIAIQHRMESVADRIVEEHQAGSVMLLALDSSSGEILGYVSRPTFDPNAFYRYDADERRNRPISFLYEPGSVFKVFSLASMLQAGGITAEDTFFCNGFYELKVDRERTIRINCLGAHGEVDLESILKYSCNAGAAYASERISDSAFYTLLRQFGFGEPTGVEMNGEELGLFRRPDQWSLRSKPTIAMGQEISVTALQVASAATAIANDGVLLKPRIVRKVISPDGTEVRSFRPEPIRQVVSPGVADAILHHMEAPTEQGGTAWRARVEGLRISAKTGTGEVYDPATGGYSSDNFIASTLAIFPTDRPRVILYVVIGHPQGDSYYGGRIAAPVVAELADYLADYLGIPREGDLVVPHSGRIEVREPKIPQIDGVVPDYSGLPKRTLLPLLGREDISTRIIGDGWVVRQDPPPGTPFRPGMHLTLELE